MTQPLPTNRRVEFKFDDPSKTSVEELKAQGFEFHEIKVGDKVLMVPKLKGAK